MLKAVPGKQGSGGSGAGGLVDSGRLGSAPTSESFLLSGPDNSPPSHHWGHKRCLLVLGLGPGGNMGAVMEGLLPSTLYEGTPSSWSRLGCLSL